MNKIYNRLLEKEIIDQADELSSIHGELFPARLMTDDFKRTEEQSSKKINDLQGKYEMANEDRKADKVAFDKRLNQLIRDFVKVYKQLANEFRQYKEFVSFEKEIF